MKACTHFGGLQLQSNTNNNIFSTIFYCPPLFPPKIYIFVQMDDLLFFLNGTITRLCTGGVGPLYFGGKNQPPGGALHLEGFIALLLLSCVYGWRGESNWQLCCTQERALLAMMLAPLIRCWCLFYVKLTFVRFIGVKSGRKGIFLDAKERPIFRFFRFDYLRRSCTYVIYHIFHTNRNRSCTYIHACGTTEGQPNAIRGEGGGTSPGTETPTNKVVRSQL